MTPDRIKLFLRCFYKQYLLQSYQRVEAGGQQGDLSQEIEQYDVPAYLIKHLDIYLDSCDPMKDYNMVYNIRLFETTKITEPELFNELQIFMIENILLFWHTILEAAIQSHMLKSGKPEKVKLHLLPIDNLEIQLTSLIQQAEEEMEQMNVLPPARG
jgi:hypothetical protein